MNSTERKLASLARRGHILQREEKFRFIYDNFESDFGAYANKITRKGIEEDLKIFGVKTQATCLF